MTDIRMDINKLGGNDPVKLADHEKMQAAAEEFESVFLAQVLRGMSTGLEETGPLSNGDGDPFADMLQQEYAKLISRSGGVGIADAVLKEMLKMQEQGQ